MNFVLVHAILVYLQVRRTDLAIFSTVGRQDARYLAAHKLSPRIQVRPLAMMVSTADHAWSNCSLAFTARRSNPFFWDVLSNSSRKSDLDFDDAIVILEILLLNVIAIR